MESAPESVAQRLARLEARVAELDAEVAVLKSRAFTAPAPSSTSDAAPLPARAVPPPMPRRAAPPAHEEFQLSDLASGEWLARIGIGLLLLGVVFLLKYSIDQGWIGPAVRVGMGAVLGGVLVAAGWLVRARREALAQVLQGGGVAVLYGSLFAAFQLYALLGYTTAFVLMVAVTALGFGLSVLGRHRVLSVVAVLGGLGTPFLLTREPGTLVGLMTYTLVVLAGGGAVYLRFRWEALLGAMVVGGVFVVGVAALFSLPETAPLAETLAFQVGVIAVWAVATVLPLVPGERRTFTSTEGALLVVAALGLLLGTAHAWRMSESGAGLLAFGLMVGYAAAFWLKARVGLLADALLVAAALLLAVSGALVLGGAFRLVSPALAGLALVTLRKGRADTVVLVAGLLLFGTSFAVAALMLDASPGAAPLREGNPYALLLTVGLLGGAAYLLRWLPLAVTTYLLFLGWQVYVFSGVPGSGAWASVGWGVTGVAAVVWGIRSDAVALRLWGLGTLVAAIAKLLLLDLPDLGTLARTLLFLGAGVVLLLVSYFVPNLLRRVPDERAAPTPSDG